MEKHDGSEVLPAATGTGDARAYIAWAAIALLVVSLALPVVELPIVGAQTVLGMSAATAYWFVGFAVFAGVAVLLKWYRLLAIPGMLVLGMTFFYVYHFDALKHDVAARMQGNIFSGVAQGMLATIQLRYGITVILIAAVALVTASFLTRDAATLRGVFAANRRAFIGGAAALVALLLLVALAPALFHAAP